MSLPKSVAIRHESKQPYFVIKGEDRTTVNNKPNNIIRDNVKGTCLLVDVAIAGHRNMMKKETENILKHKDLTIEITERVVCKNKTDIQ
jgi:hypothetical protein